MKIPKPSEADKEFFESIVPSGAQVKRMFGNLGGFVNGNMFMGLFGADVGLRLDAARRSELEAIEGSGPFGPEDRPMREYVAVPRAWRNDPEQLTPWVNWSYEHAAAMPPKRPKKK